MAYKVYNQGELSGLAHGWRSVLALEPGRKWITVIDWSTLEVARVALSVWQGMRPELADNFSPRRVKAIMKRRLRYVTPTQAIKEAMKKL